MVRLELGAAVPEAREAADDVLERPPETEVHEECAICFEPGTFVDLPCSCAIKYCTSCWDRALATSVTVRGRAQCPSCRSAFKVDFDTESSSLVFSKDPQGTAACDWRSQLYEKVRHVQIRLLQGYGNATTAQSSSPSCGRWDAIPHCVCGAELEHISSRSRILRFLEDMDSSWRHRIADNMVERLLDSSLVTCDLCDKVAIRRPGSKGLWTCKNGPHTVMHPAAYDVCESCFEKYSGVHVQLGDGRSSRTKPRSVLCWESSRVGQTCCQACSAVLGALRAAQEVRSHEDQDTEAVHLGRRSQAGLGRAKEAAEHWK